MKLCVGMGGVLATINANREARGGNQFAWLEQDEQDGVGCRPGEDELCMSGWGGGTEIRFQHCKISDKVTFAEVRCWASSGLPMEPSLESVGVNPA